MQAKNEKGEFVTLFTLTKEKIAVLKKTSQFFCPTCHEKVQIKAGKTKIPHFAHLPNQIVQHGLGRGSIPFGREATVVLLAKTANFQCIVRTVHTRN
ncbi:competence protein CoiA family protein [Paracerasibacillus soli]|uniref:Competence protein CoiA family protein n=1 Tax=Paracerasibacillus soli TaxID=480284 RepID=A0ABU5CQ14_9BACI|nr:competence protein CoiA family protein [Virgibacillus soli]MDY0407907.1 competence protein CoiA family protein [Virgibacillus soli]